MYRLSVLFVLFILTLTACAGEAGEVDKPAEELPDSVPVTISGALSTLPPATVESEGETAGPNHVETLAETVTIAPSATVPLTATPETDVEIENNNEPISTQPPDRIEETTTVNDLTPVPGEIAAAVPTYGYQIVNEYPHDRESFTQGLIVDDETGLLLEGSGLYGESSLRRVDLETGVVTQIVPLPDEYFGEGITTFDDKIFQLTWKTGVGFVYDQSSFELLEQFNYAHQGWGITHDGQQLIVSDGTDTIHFWDPESLQETGQIQVADENGAVTQLNELEYVEGAILANVWQTDTIVRIDPSTGQVIGRIKLGGLLSDEDRIGTEGVLNGIAYDSDTKRLFVTGKRWPKLFEIELIEVNVSN